MKIIAKMKPISRIHQLAYANKLRPGYHDMNGVFQQPDLITKLDLSYKSISKYDKNNRIWSRRVSDNLTRYDFGEMSKLFDRILACDRRHYSEAFENFKECSVPMLYDGVQITAVVHDDFWSEFQYKLFRHQMCNDQGNSIYIGLDWEYIEKKIGRKPTPFEKVLQRIWRNIFIHLSHDKKKNWVRVWNSW